MSGRRVLSLLWACTLVALGLLQLVAVPHGSEFRYVYDVTTLAR